MLAFELNALVVAANTAFLLQDDETPIARARAAAARVILASMPSAEAG